MKLLIVASGNGKLGVASPFIVEQANSLKDLGHQVEFFLILGRGLISYIKHIPKLWIYLHQNRYDIIHAHFLWSGFIAVCQISCPVVVTFHGCDLNNVKLRYFSTFIVYRFAKHGIVVNMEMLKYLHGAKKTCIPCGVDLHLFKALDIIIAKQKLKLNVNKKYILFASSFERPEKNADLAFKAIDLMKNQIDFLEFSGYTREESAYLFSAVNCLLLTSIREGSPQVIKEAMACGCPIVSTDVGDVRWLLGDTRNCFISSFEPQDIAQKLELVFSNGERTNGRERILKLGLDLSSIAKHIDQVYKEVKK